MYCVMYLSGFPPHIVDLLYNFWCIRPYFGNPSMRGMFQLGNFDLPQYKPAYLMSSWHLSAAS